jgi:hypothetical protein
MRGDATEQLTMLTAVTPDTLVPADHPIRAIRVIVDRALQTLSPTFDAMYDRIGRPSIPPEHLLKAMLLQSFYSIRSERQLCERLQYDLTRFRCGTLCTAIAPPLEVTIELYANRSSRLPPNAAAEWRQRRRESGRPLFPAFNVGPKGSRLGHAARRRVCCSLRRASMSVANSGFAK